MPIDSAAEPWCLPDTSFQDAMAMIGASLTAMAASQHQIARSLGVPRTRRITALTADPTCGFAVLSEDTAGWLHEVFVEGAGRRTHVALMTVSTTAVNTATELQD